MSQQTDPRGVDETTTANTERVFIFDTTLRDGEQCPGATMTFEEKLEVADFLEAMGVDIIEAGFPIASEGDFQAVSEIAKRIKNSVVCGLSRAGEADIDRAGEAVKHAARPRIHTFLSPSPVHRKHKLQKSAEQVLEMVQFQVTRARNWCEDVEWSAEDATRTEIDYLCRCVETAIKAGATTINLPDTVGYATPEEYFQMFRTVMEKVPGSEKVIFSVHCHNDLGMAVANSLAGVRAGCPITSASMHSSSTVHPGWWRRRPRFRCSTTRRSWAGMRSRTRAASTRTACSSTRRPTRS
jgi:2-isopropylmalate synthase